MVIDPTSLDMNGIATALSDQTDYDHRWLIDARTGKIEFWTVDTGIDGENPIDLEELDLVPIGPLPSHVWHQDMADFAEGLSDATAGRRLAGAIQGKGAFRRFKDELSREYPELLSPWHAFRDARSKRRAGEWLVDERLNDDDAAHLLMTEHLDPDLP